MKSPSARVRIWTFCDYGIDKFGWQLQTEHNEVGKNRPEINRYKKRGIFRGES